MTKYEGLTPEERARVTEIQDLLIERFVERKEAIEEGHEVRAKELEAEINELQHEKERKEVGSRRIGLVDEIR
jgi:molybdenum-dependent DNA-binding transcriptional regulator ModE